LANTAQDFSGVKDTGWAEHHTITDWDIQARPVANIHLELLVDRELDKGLVSHMMDNPSDVCFVDSLHMAVVLQVEESGFRTAVEVEIVSFGIHNLGFYRVMSASQLWEMERGSS
jgi:hypothetical protein